MSNDQSQIEQIMKNYNVNILETFLVLQRRIDRIEDMCLKQKKTTLIKRLMK